MGRDAGAGESHRAGGELVVICAEGHLFRAGWPSGTGTLPVYCPVGSHRSTAHPVDPRMLSAQGLAEAWQHHGRALPGAR